MKKIFTLFIALTFISNINSQNNTQSHYISEMFSAVFSNSIQAGLESKPYNNIYATSDSNLFVVNRRGFIDPTSQGYAKISKINALTGVNENYFIAPSPTYIENGGVIGRIWIWALGATDPFLFVAVDEGIWIYYRNDSNQYEYFKTVSLPNVTHLETTNTELHAFIENNDGYDWFKVNLSNYEIDTVRPLVLKNHFFLQIAPVKMLSVRNNALYLLQQKEPSVEKYSLTGKFLAEYPLKISNWRPIPDEITTILDSIEDITERNYAFASYSIFDYNMMHLFYVFPSEKFFIIAIDKNKTSETFVTPYFVQIVGDTTTILPYTIKLSENEKFDKEHFPFLSAGAEGNIVFTQFNDGITQVNLGTPVSWHNKTQKEYKNEVNLYHRDNNPIEKIETYQFIKNIIPIDSIQFLDYDNNSFYLNKVKKDKAIFIISQYPQCSSCIKTIWSYFSNKILHDVELYNVGQNCPTYLSKKEYIKEVKDFLKTEFTPLFMDNEKHNSATKFLTTQKTSPLVLLFDKKLQHIEVITATHIIGDFMGNLNPSFIHTIDNFAEN